MTDTPFNEGTDEVFDPTNVVPVKGAAQPPADETSLMTMPKADAVREMMKDWDASWKDIKSISEQWRVNKARNDGYTGVSIIKRQDKNEAYIPLNARKGVSGLNKAARLCRAVVSAIFTDPAKAEATPAGDDDEDRDAAETSTRVLADLCSEGNLDYNLASRDASDLGSIYGSGFVRFWVDETGGGWVPKEAETDTAAASDTVLQYVTADGQLTEDRMAADRVWQPRVKREILTGKHVRFIPFHGTRDIWEADGVMIGAARSLGELKRMFPEIRKWDADRLAKLVTTRPQHFNELLPYGKKDTTSQDPTKDESMCFVLTRFHVQSPKYPEGAYLLAAGTDEMLYRGKWFDETHAEPLDIPITQLKQLTEEGNPYGVGLMEQLGPGNEIRAQMIGSWLEHLDRFNNRRIFVPMTSTLQAQQLQSPTGTPIPILPGGEPKYEELPDFPVITEKMLAFISTEMDDESRLQQVGQGLNPSGVKSGLHANAIREQVQVGLSDLREHFERGVVRGWRIILQQTRAFYSEPQQIRWMGNDGRYKVQKWSQADLGSTKDVRVQKGSFTGLTPQGKANEAIMYHQMGLLPPAELEHVLESQLGGLLGLQDNAHRLRIRRQIATWEEGPPDGWMPAPQIPTVDPTTGQPVPPAPDPVLTSIFDVRPVDQLPDAAGIRVYELGRAMDGTGYARWPKEWQVGMEQAFMQAKASAQVLDAESVQKIQQGAQEAGQKLQQAQAKLAEKPSISLALKAGFMLDQAQVGAILAQEGMQLPAGGVAEPVLDPNAEMQTKAQLESQKIQAEVDKHRIGAAADVEKARVDVQKEAQQHKPVTILNTTPEGAIASLSDAFNASQQDTSAVKQVVAGLRQQVQALDAHVKKRKKLKVIRGAPSPSHPKGEITGAEVVD